MRGLRILSCQRDMPSGHVTVDVTLSPGRGRVVRLLCGSCEAEVLLCRLQMRIYPEFPSRDVCPPALSPFLDLRKPRLGEGRGPLVDIHTGLCSQAGRPRSLCVFFPVCPVPQSQPGPQGTRGHPSESSILAHSLLIQTCHSRRLPCAALALNLWAC